MSSRRSWALVLMGMWMAGTICVSVVATENFYTIDRLLTAKTSNAAFASAVDRLGARESRDLLRYLSSELNRLYFQMWNVAQVVLAALVLLLITGTRQRRIIGNETAARAVALMFTIVLFMLVWLTPEIVKLGRSLDFVPRDPPPPGMSRFWTLHAAFTSLELFKLAVGMFVTYVLAKPRDVVVMSTNPVSVSVDR